MSSKRLATIADFSRHGYTLRVDCLQCRRVAVFNPLEITMICQQHGWSKQMASVEGRLRCSKCGSRDIRLGPAFSH
jgi:Zn finger protein HypA/HybF involved in hydrogenase expression|tara:strand:+ start:1204 stop:1431 length:228 start_codon:yes stop_codon:yes gene_type:complete